MGELARASAMKGRAGVTPAYFLCNDLRNDSAMYIRQTPVEATVAERETLVIQPEQVQNGRVLFITHGGVFRGGVGKLVALAVGNSAFDSAACKPAYESIAVVIAAIAALAVWGAAKFTR